MAGKLIDELNERYLAVHETFENHFWATKMAHAGSSRDALTESKKALDSFLCDSGNLARVDEALAALMSEPALRQEQQEQVTVLTMMQKTFRTYLLSDPSAKDLKNVILEKENTLAGLRNNMKLGYTNPHSGEFVAASSVQLRNTMRVSDDEAVRKACYEGLLSIGDLVAPKLGEIVILRNKLARSLGYLDFYDMNVSMGEGFGKVALFEMLDQLQRPLQGTNARAREALRAEKQAQNCTVDPLLPWNTGFCMSGSVEAEMSPYFPFDQAVERWGRSFARLGLNYRGATLSLDLLERPGKYSNGFAHWPVPAFRRSDGSWVPSRGNFTSLASPNAIGSGRAAIKTLLHEAGHACHFGNIDPCGSVGSPMFSQERAPQSIAYAETQSMFLDKLILEGDWLATYAQDSQGNRIPWSLIEKHIRSVQPYEVFAVRGMLAVPYFEKALYELSDQDLADADKIKALAVRVEEEISGGRSSLPLLAVPHILSAEASCYYHGYVLADMAVHQTREYFNNKYGYISDNSAVGPELLESYWKPGASKGFLDIVRDLTGKPLSAQAWLNVVGCSVEDKVNKVRIDYERAVQSRAAEDAEIDLGINLRIVHGDLLITDDKRDGGFLAACRKFRQYTAANYPTDFPTLSS